MALNHKWTLVCDDVRREDNGKLIVVGLYTPGVTLPKLPSALPRLVFLNYFEVTTPGVWNLTFKFAHKDTGALVGQTGSARVEVPSGATIDPSKGSGAVMPVTIGNVHFQMDGIYVFSVTGQDFAGIAIEVPVSLQPRTH